MFSWWVGQMRARTASSMSRPERRSAVTARPLYSVVRQITRDDGVGREGQAPHLLGLLLVVRAADRSLPGVGEHPLEGVDVLALVELPSDPPPVGLVNEVAGGVHRAAQRAVLLDRGGEGVLLPS